MQRTLAAAFLALTFVFVGIVHFTNDTDLTGQAAPGTSTENINGATVTRASDGTVIGMAYPALGVFSLLDRNTPQARIVFTSEQGGTQIVWRQLVWTANDPGQGRVRVFLSWWGQLMRVQSTTTSGNQTTRVIADLKKDASPLAMSGIVLNNQGVLRSYIFSKLGSAVSDPATCTPGNCPAFHAAPTTVPRTPLLSVRVPSVATDASATVTDRFLYANIGTLTKPQEHHVYQFDWDKKMALETQDMSAGVRATRWKDVTLQPATGNGFSQLTGNYYGHPIDISETIATPSGAIKTAHIDYPQLNTTVVRLSDPDLQQVYGTSGAYQLFKAAIQKVRATHAGILELDGGTYVIEPPQGLSPDDVLMEISDIQDLLVEGKGTHLLFRSIRTGLRVGSAVSTVVTNRIHLRDFSIDWADPMAFKGQIQQVNNGKNKATYLLLDDPQLAQLSQAPQITVVVDFNPTTKTWGFPSDGNRSRVDLTYVEHPQDGPQLFGAQVQGKYLYKFKENLEWIPNGTTVIATMRTPKAALEVKNAGNVTMENSTIYASPTIAFLGNGAGNGFRVVNSKVIRNPNDPNRLVSTLGDGIHVLAQGNVFVENNLVESQGDDGLNIKGMFSAPSFVSGDRTLLQSNGNTVPLKVGDHITLSNSVTLKPIGMYSIAEKVNPGKDGCPNGTGQKSCMRFAAPLPPEVGIDNSLMSNMDFASSPFIVRGNTFRNNRARGMLIETGPGLIENNTVNGQTHGGIWLMTDTVHYGIGPGPSDVTVRSNNVSHTGYATDRRLQSILNPDGGAMTPMAGIVVEPRVPLNGNPPVGISPDRVFHDILIDGNTVSDMPGLGLFVTSSRNVRITNNTITDTNHWNFLPGAPVKNAVTIMRASNVQLQGNKVQNGIFVDPATTDSVTQQ